MGGPPGRYRHHTALAAASESALHFCRDPKNVLQFFSCSLSQTRIVCRSQDTRRAISAIGMQGRTLDREMMRQRTSSSVCEWKRLRFAQYARIRAEATFLLIYGLCQSQCEKWLFFVFSRLFFFDHDRHPLPTAHLRPGPYYVHYRVIPIPISV